MQSPNKYCRPTHLESAIDDLLRASWKHEYSNYGFHNDQIQRCEMSTNQYMNMQNSQQYPNGVPFPTDSSTPEQIRNDCCRFYERSVFESPPSLKYYNCCPSKLECVASGATTFVRIKEEQANSCPKLREMNVPDSPIFPEVIGPKVDYSWNSVTSVGFSNGVQVPPSWGESLNSSIASRLHCPETSSRTVRKQHQRVQDRNRTRSLNSAFGRLRSCLPKIPKDTKLTKIRTLRYAISYIRQLMDTVKQDEPSTVQPYNCEPSVCSHDDGISLIACSFQVSTEEPLLRDSGYDSLLEK